MFFNLFQQRTRKSEWACLFSDFIYSPLFVSCKQLWEAITIHHSEKGGMLHYQRLDLIQMLAENTE